MIDLEAVRFDDRGLLPAVIQDARTKEVLTLAYMNRESLARTLEEGETWFWSRSRGSLWHKGETSGHTQRVVRIALDCDGDALLVEVEPAGPACHTGERTCFYRTLAGPPEGEAPSGGPPSRARGGSGEGVLRDLWETIDERYRTRPEGSYTSYLFDQGLDKILKKIGEETAETIIAAKGTSGRPDLAEVRYESADLLYHLLVMWRQVGLEPDEVWMELKNRHLVKDESPRRDSGFKRRG